MNLILQFIKRLSILFYVLVLLYVYYKLPPYLLVKFNLPGLTEGSMNKSEVFYIFLLFGILWNGIILFFLKTIETIPVRFFQPPNRKFWFSDQESKEAFYEVVSSWANSLTIFINLGMSMMLLKLLWINTQLAHSGDDLFFYTAFILSIFPLWVFFFLMRFRVKKHYIFR